MRFFSQYAFVAQQELWVLRRHPTMLIALLVVALLPSVYAAIYLTSVWDPAARTNALPVALINLDEGVQYKDHTFNIGDQVMHKLTRNARFGYAVHHDPEQARQAVRSGTLAFALIIPKDFSSNAVPGAQPGGGKLTIYVSEGNNYQTAAIAKQFANELGHEVNESINERRWALVLNNAAGSQRSVDALRAGVAHVRQGAQELHQGTAKASAAAQAISAGSGKLHTGVDQLTEGFKQLGNGLRTLDARRVPNSELTRLKTGADALSAGHTELGQGLQTLQTGSRTLAQAVADYQTEADDSLLMPSRAKEGLSQLAQGVQQLNQGLHEASDGQKKLADGAQQLSTSVGALTTGLRSMNSSVRQAVTKLPEDSQLDELSSGSTQLSTSTSALSDGLQKLKSGSQSLSAGLDVLWQSLPTAVDTPEGSPEGLANSVQPVVEVDAAVANSGSGFAANVIPAALWLGAGIAAFLIHIRILPLHAQGFASAPKLLGKITLPVLVVVLQALLLGLTVHWGLHIHIQNGAAFAACLGVAGLAFLFIVVLLTRTFGDAGKAFAMVLLAVQLSASGGVLPVELSGGLYETISPWLPMTWVVRAVKASMFAAYNGAWQYPLTQVAAFGLVSIALAIRVGRWRYLQTNHIPPSIQL